MPRVIPTPARLAIAAFLPPLAIAACSNLLDIAGPVSVADASATPPLACGLPAGTPACQECIEASCCTQAAACAADDACSAHESCVIPCGADYACRAACDNAHPPSTPQIAATDQCVVASCASTCGIRCGTAGIEIEPDAAGQCEQCIVAHACGPTEACGQSLECTQILDCQAGCVTPDCQAACSDGKDGGQALVQALSSAVASSCLAECQYGERWGCIGKLQFPLASTPQIDLTLDVISQPSGTGLSGVSVLACSAIDLPCSTPLTSGTTDASGIVTLAIPANAQGFSGHLELSGNGIMPELYFFDYNLTVPSSSLVVDVFSPSTFAALVGTTNVTVDPTHGSILLAAFDCALDPAPNVVISATGTDAESRILYVANGMLSTTATSTNQSGTALIVDVPHGQVTVTARAPAAGQVSAETSVTVRAGATTYVGLYPRSKN